MLYNTKNPHGGNIYEEPITLDYSANCNPLGTPAGVLNSIQKATSSIYNYPDPYCSELIYAISEFENIPREYILCGSGAAELIYSFCRALNPRVALELAPTFLEYSLALDSVSCKILRYKLKQENDFRLDNNFLSYILDTNPDVIFLCNPNNPTGALINGKLLQDIIKLCIKENIYIFIDECFLNLADKSISVKSFLTKTPNLFILKAFTKDYGMAGIRLGYCLCSNEKLLFKMSNAVQPWNVSIPAQIAGIAALKEEDFLKKAKALIKEERPWLTKELTALGFWICPTNANYILFKGKAGLDISLRREGIAIRSCDNYHGLGIGWYRIAVKLHNENKVLISTIKRILERE